MNTPPNSRENTNQAIRWAFLAPLSIFAREAKLGIDDVAFLSSSKISYESAASDPTIEQTPLI